MLTDYDLHLLKEETHFKSYEKMGAHIVVKDAMAGINFTVWAPNASKVNVVGDFNKWIIGEIGFKKRRPLNHAGKRN